MPGHDVPEAPALLSRIFPDLHYIWLSRRDKVRQAISHWKAMQTGVRGDTGDATIKPTKEPDYDFEAIHHLVQDAAESDAAWAAYFAEHGLEPWKVVYEDFVDDYASTLLRILGFPGISLPDSPGVEKRRLRKQTNAMTEMWLHRYLSAVSE